jgi:ornithine decarboxylase
MSPSAIATIETTTINSYYESIKSVHIEHNGATVAKQLIGDALKEKIGTIDHDLCEPGDEDTFFVADLGEVYRQHMRWKLNLPRVRPFYGKPSRSSHSSSLLTFQQRSNATLMPKSFAFLEN